MKTPAFWRRRGIAAFLLLPFSMVYRAASCLRFHCIRPCKAGAPVLVVGGVTAGGAGKTPVCLHLGELCKSLGIQAFFVTRGYKGKLKGPVQVRREHTAYMVGDEPLLLSRVLPTVMAKNRLQGARFAAKQGAELIIMDDGFQNPAIHKDKSLVVIDGRIGLGNGFLIPAGPLREPAKSGFARADAVIVLNPQGAMPYVPNDKPVFRATVRTNDEAANLAEKKVLAFCGLAYPQKFFDTLRALGANVMEAKTFPDHYQYKDAEIDALALAARKQDAVLVTTSKDAARMDARALSLVTVVQVSLVFDQPDALAAILKTLAGRA